MYLKFLNSKKAIECSVIAVGDNVVTILPKAKISVNTTGFDLYLDKDCENNIGGDYYHGFTTVYRNDSETKKYNGYQLSNDGSVYEKEKHTVLFRAGANGHLSGNLEIKADDYSSLIVPEASGEEGYKFSGWIPEIPKDGDIKEDITFTAIFCEKPTVTFKSSENGGIIGNSMQKVDRYEDLKIPDVSPISGYEFAGWLPEIPASGDIDTSKKFTAKIRKIFVPTIRFTVSDKGTISGDAEQHATSYENIVVPSVETEGNYRFTGWVPEVPKSGSIESDVTFAADIEYVPTLDDVKEEKILSLNSEQQSAIAEGFDITLTNGTVEHFTLTERDQTSLIGLQTLVMSGAESIPWHTSDHSEHCRYYSNADMSLIVSKALQFVTYHVTYFRDLRIYVNSMVDKESVNAAYYGMYVPEEYQSEVLKDIYKQSN